MIQLTDLTRTQFKVFQHLLKRRKSGYPPTLDELCAELGLSSRGSLHKHIKVLVKAGLVEPMEGRQRGVRLAISAREGR